MKKFKFLQKNQLDQNEINNEVSNPFNGVTDEYLINLSQEIWNYSVWIKKVGVSHSIERNQDCLYFKLKDIDISLYIVTIYQDLSYEIIPIIEDELGNEEELDILDIEINSRLDHNTILNYLKNMPKTIINSL